MTPNEICREIVTRLQLGGGLNEDQTNLGSEWRARVKSYHVACRAVWNFESLDHVAEAIREVGDGMEFSISRNPQSPQGWCVGYVWKNGANYEDAFGQNEAEALTRALYHFLKANKIGEEHLQPPEPEEPWIDVSESVSTANLPEHQMPCIVEFDDGGREHTHWEKWSVVWKTSTPGKAINAFLPKALGGSVVKWRYAK